ncbi:MAG TPA: hypothetical protein VLT36_15155 [Candidatus Dormibacteraeota bacterium]|nr:hypothetical protein [Candidatus Dormibacteraeota bacterium]
MKRLYTLIVLLGLVMGAMLTGCDNGSKTDTTPTASTNAQTAPSTTTTNK